MKSAILITSIGTKIPLIGAVRGAKDMFDDSLQIIGADINTDAIAKPFVDQFWHIPSLDVLSYKELVLYAKSNAVSYIIPTRDAELPFFSQYKKALHSEGIEVFIADEKAVNFCYDKLHFYTDSKILWAIPTSLDINHIKAQRFVVKERFGAGSQTIACDVNKEQAILHAKKLQEPIFQEFISGKEYSIDCYVDKNMTCRGVIVRSRDMVVNGESQVTTIVHDTELSTKASRFVTTHQIQGHSVLQVLKNTKGSFLIECNTRFGGASTLSEYVGLKSFLWFLQEVNNQEFQVNITNKIVKQVRANKKDSYFES